MIYIIDEEKHRYLEENPIEGNCFSKVANAPFVLRFVSYGEALKYVNKHKIKNVLLIEANHHSTNFQGKDV